MIVVTGAAGFISSVVITDLQKLGFKDIIGVDDFSHPAKKPNYETKGITLIERNVFLDWLIKNGKDVQAVIHLGARTDTAEFDITIFDALNLNYSKGVWKQCVQQEIPLIYASSAATYGGGEYGYEDSHTIIPKLIPLNPYGESKNNFDKWVLKQEQTPPFWAGLKFFNVYGPNEYHKARMASVILHTFRQIEKTGAMKLFKSHNPKFKNGEQMRDFIYVKDVAKVILFLLKNNKDSGIYNLGTGKARTFLDLATNTFKALGKEPALSFIDTPIDIRDKYQYFTQADMSKLLAIGYDGGFHTLEEGVKDYVQNYLVSKSIY